jgi:hypothetical protein
MCPPPLKLRRDNARLWRALVEAAGVEPDNSVENAQLIDSGNARIGMIFRIAKSTVRSLYGDFPEFPQLPNSTFGRPFLAKTAF